jgi:hypothetical protein
MRDENSCLDHHLHRIPARSGPLVAHIAQGQERTDRGRSNKRNDYQRRHAA